MSRICIFFAFLFMFLSGTARAQCNATFQYTVNGPIAYFWPKDSLHTQQHRWEIGTLQVYSGATVSHTFSAPGTYLVRHIVWDTLAQCTDTAVQQVRLNFVPVCNVDFSIRVDSSAENSYRFTANVHSTPFTRFQWTVNGQPAGTTADITKALEPGSYNICLTATTAEGCTASVCHYLLVKPKTPCPEAAAIEFSVDPQDAHTYTFIGVPNRTGAVYTWKFGYGTAYYGRTLKYTFARAGNYEVALEIYDSTAKCVSQVVRTITVQPNASENCTVQIRTRREQGRPHLLQLLAESNQPIISYRWQVSENRYFSDSVVYTEAGPLVPVRNKGTYYIRLEVKTATGCTAWALDSVQIENGNSQLVPVYPNPVQGEAVLPVTLSQNGAILLTVFDAMGTEVLRKTVAGTAGNNTVRIPAEQLQRGTYFVTIRSGGTLQRSRF
ncbi:MAG TPA: PKD domain-containing protein, partial [Chitinophagaceae bacterium]|nr:PKD domain-containing protein [Chitinophagaceae bacterium]